MRGAVLLGYIRRNRRTWQWFSVLVSGWLEYLSHPGVGLWGLGLVTFVPMALVWEETETCWRCFLSGMVAGLVAWSLALRWLPDALVESADATASSAQLASVSAILLQALPLGCGGALYGTLRKLSCPIELALPAAMVVTEVFVPTPLPYSHAAVLSDVPLLMQLAPFGGRSLVASVLFSFNGALVAAIRQLGSGKGLQGWRLLLGVCPTAVALTVGGWVLLEPQTVDKYLRIALVQTSEDVAARVRKPRAVLEQHLTLTAVQVRYQSPVDLAVWGETVFLQPVSETSILTELRRELRSISLQPLPVPILAGVVVAADQGSVHYNSAVLLRAPATGTGAREHEAPCRACRYDKQRLVPLAEGLPRGWPWAELWFPWAGRYATGPYDQPIRMSSGVGLGVLICFEAIFAERGRHLVRSGAEILINLVDDQWIRDAVARRAHDALSRLTAIELRRTLVRLNAGGPSVVVDRLGRTVWRLEEVTPAADVVQAEAGTEITFYARWGDAGTIMSLTFALLLAVWLGRRPPIRRTVREEVPPALRRLSRHHPTGM